MVLAPWTDTAVHLLLGTTRDKGRHRYKQAQMMGLLDKLLALSPDGINALNDIGDLSDGEEWQEIDGVACCR